MVFAFYTYNALGYITNIKKNGTTIATYSYDALGQLVGETVNNQIYIYSYDKAGNITQKHVYTGDIGNLTDTINYTYSTSAWGDLLTNYDGTAITYDSIGNPTNWRNSSSLTWDGRMLISQELTNDNSITYKYNSDGIRTQKRVFDDVASAYITHDYVLDGTKILSETVTDAAYGNSYALYYVYDANGSITGLHYNGAPYYFQKSIQGDVLRICNAGGAVVVEYAYDAWGNILSVTGSMATTLGQYNPFRYRGYYYDGETDLYYLQSRYYDAEVGRFINADGVVGANGGLQGYNMFAYCNNNPVAFSDPSGYVAYKLSDNAYGDNPFHGEPIFGSGGGLSKSNSVTINHGIGDLTLYGITKADINVKFSRNNKTLILNLYGEVLYFKICARGVISTNAPDNITIKYDSRYNIHTIIYTVEAERKVIYLFFSSAGSRTRGTYSQDIGSLLFGSPSANNLESVGGGGGGPGFVRYKIDNYSTIDLEEILK